MIEQRTLLDAGGLRLFDVRCGCPRDDWGCEETVDATRLVLPRSGVFEHRSRGVSTIAEANRLLWFHDAHTYRIRHPVDGGDRCTAIAIAPRALAEIVESVGVDPETVDSLRSATIGSGLDAEHRELALLADTADDGLALEEACTRLVARAVVAAARESDRGPADLPEPSASWRCLAERTRLALAERLDEPVNLRELALAVGCSASHLCRLFRRETGLSIGDYRKSLRIRAAKERLADGEDDLTTLALDLGFYDHAHFTRTFRSAVGVPPSRWRQRLPA